MAKDEAPPLGLCQFCTPPSELSQIWSSRWQSCPPPLRSNTFWAQLAATITEPWAEPVDVWSTVPVCCCVQVWVSAIIDSELQTLHITIVTINEGNMYSLRPFKLAYIAVPTVACHGTKFTPRCAATTTWLAQ